MTAIALLALALIDPAAEAWKAAPAIDVALYRTPPLHATDPPAALEIVSTRVQFAREQGKTIVRIEWKDPSADKSADAPGGFADACAFMVPAHPVKDDVYPSLQMGDANHPVTIYYHDAARGAAVMEAAGRGTTRRTGRDFPARAVHTGDRWQVTLELPEVAAGTPFSLAIWNGRQQDRDGRKYFSIWHRTP